MTNVRSAGFFDSPTSLPGADSGTVTSGQVTDTGMLAEGMCLVSFAGQVVPEDGLHVWPPCGGELTVWPDGRFVFEPGEVYAAHASQDDMGVYYSYVVSAADGSLLTGSLAVDVAVPDPADGFQAWSMDDVLAMETSLASVVGLAAEGGAWTGADAGHDLWDQGGDGGLSGGSDLLEHMFKTAHEG